jgi:hypothetical protein
MSNEASDFTVLNGDLAPGAAPEPLTDLDLGLILGGNASDVTGSNSQQQPGSGNWENSGEYRNGAVQMAAAVGGVVAAGIGLMTAPISVPVAIVGALAAAVVGGVAAADAQGDMQSAKAD